MKSPEKVLLFLEQMQSYSDEEISEAIPLGLPAPALRGALAGVAMQVPDDPGELDELLGRLESFCQQLRSDEDAPPATT